MKKFKVLFGLSAAALAAMALYGAASASAFATWQEDGSNVTGAVNVSLADNGSGLSLGHTGGSFGTVTINCKGSGAGTVNTGGAGTVTSASASSCTTTAGSCGSPNAAALHTTWNTTISGSRDDLTSADGNHDAGWNVTCFGFVQVSCTGDTSTGIANGSGVVDLTFDSTSGSVPCSDRGSGTVRGTVVASISGHSLQAN